MMNADNVSFYNEYQKFRDYVLYADTSFWVELADQPDAQCRLRSFLQRSGKTVQVPRVVLDELNHLMSIPEKAARAAGAQRLLGELEHGRMLTFFGSLDDSISGLLADAVFLAEFERRRVFRRFRVLRKRIRKRVRFFCKCGIVEFFAFVRKFARRKGRAFGVC